MSHAALDSVHDDPAARREHTRVLLQASVSGGSQNNFFVGFSENISAGGIFVATWCPPAVGESVDVSISIPGTKGFMVKGKVRWHRTNRFREPTGCGIQFVDMSKGQAVKVEDALRLSGQVPLLHEVD